MQRKTHRVSGFTFLPLQLLDPSVIHTFYQHLDAETFFLLIYSVYMLNSFFFNPSTKFINLSKRKACTTSDILISNNKKHYKVYWRRLIFYSQLGYTRHRSPKHQLIQILFRAHRPHITRPKVRYTLAPSSAAQSQSDDVLVSASPPPHLLSNKIQERAFLRTANTRRRRTKALTLLQGLGHPLTRRTPSVNAAALYAAVDIYWEIYAIRLPVK